MDLEGNIMYCSRNPIPSSKSTELVYNKDGSISIYNLHIGVFVFNADYLMNQYRNKHRLVYHELSII